MFLLTEEKVISTFMIPLLVLTCPQLLREGENYKKKKKKVFIVSTNKPKGVYHPAISPTGCHTQLEFTYIFSDHKA